MRLLANMLLFAVILGGSVQVRAASQDECSIWLCLPSGFPGGCSSAYSAMKKRIKKLKNPLPELSECAPNNLSSSGAGYQTGWARKLKRSGRIDKNRRCSSKGRRRNTCNNVRYIDVLIDRKQYGKTFYW